MLGGGAGEGSDGLPDPLRRPRGQRPPGAAVPVGVDHRDAVVVVDLQPDARTAPRPQSHGDATHR